MEFSFEQNAQGNRPQVQILGEEVERVTHFKYLGTSIEEEGGMETEIAKRVGAGWMNWKKCSGVLCDKRMPVKLKGKVYRTVVRPAMLYGAETWATTKRQESRIEVNEMRMLRWMCGVTRQNQERTHTRNDESSAGVQKDNGEKTEMVWARHEDGRRSRSEESDDESDTGEKEERETKDKVEGCVQEGHADCRTERGR